MSKLLVIVVSLLVGLSNGNGLKTIDCGLKTFFSTVIKAKIMPASVCPDSNPENSFNWKFLLLTHESSRSIYQWYKGKTKAVQVSVSQWTLCWKRSARRTDAQDKIWSVCPSPKWKKCNRVKSGKKQSLQDFWMSYNVIATSLSNHQAKRLIKKFPSLKNELSALAVILAQAPDTGWHAVGKWYF